MHEGENVPRGTYLNGEGSSVKLWDDVHLTLAPKVPTVPGIHLPSVS